MVIDWARVTAHGTPLRATVSKWVNAVPRETSRLMRARSHHSARLRWVTFWVTIRRRRSNCLISEENVRQFESQRATLSIRALHDSFRPQKIKDRERPMHTDKCFLDSQKT